MTHNPFFDYYERTWISHQTTQGQHLDPCTGLSPDQIQDRVATWLLGFNPLIEPDTAAGIRVGIVQRFYGWWS